MKWNNFIMNIYEAFVHPIAAFVYCYRLQAPVWTRPWTPPTMTQTSDRQLNSADGRSSAKIILFYFMMEPRVKYNNFRTVDRRRRLGSELILFQYGTTSEMK